MDPYDVVARPPRCFSDKSNLSLLINFRKMPQLDTSHARLLPTFEDVTYVCRSQLISLILSKQIFQNFLRTDKSTMKCKFLVKQYEEDTFQLRSFWGNGLFPADCTLPIRKRPADRFALKARPLVPPSLPAQKPECQCLGLYVSELT